MQETQVQSLGGEDPLEVGMATHFSILAWKIPWTEESDGLQFMGLQRAGHKVMLKILQARFQQDMNQELPDVQTGFRKGIGTRDQIANICWIIEKARKNSRKTSTFASLTMLKPLTVWITANCGQLLKI